MIKIRELNYTYPGGTRPALIDVSIDITDGEFVLLAGPSGAGKSTLLRCLNGLIPHFSGGTIGGSVEVDGEDVMAAGPQAMSRMVGMVFQDPEAQSVVDEVESEIAFGLENSSVPAPVMQERVQEVMTLMGLTPLRRRPPWTLSGGERQKLAIASVLAGHPKVLILDEPTSQLDPPAARELIETLVRLNQLTGMTVVLVEQRLERVVRFAGRLLYMEGGRITADGPMRQSLVQVDSRQLPPLARLASKLAWDEIPLQVSEAPAFTLGHISYSHNGRQSKQDHRGNGQVAAPVLAARDVRYGYNGNDVLYGVSLELHAGEAVTLLGTNGAGKSTLLKCLVGLLRPQSGYVTLNGQSTSAMSVAQICTAIAYLPQAPDDLLFADSVSEELQITLRNHGLGGAKVDEVSQELLVELGLGELRDSYPRDLSVGQRQRVALGAVSVVGPQVLLLDEPTRGLDYRLKGELITLWRRWLNKGMALLLVTHDVELATQITRRVVVMDRGRITADGPVQEVLSTLKGFEPQMARLFPDQHWLTVDDVLQGVKNAEDH